MYIHRKVCQTGIGTFCLASERVTTFTICSLSLSMTRLGDQYSLVSYMGLRGTMYIYRQFCQAAIGTFCPASVRKTTFIFTLSLHEYDQMIPTLSQFQETNPAAGKTTTSDFGSMGSALYQQLSMAITSGGEIIPVGGTCQCLGVDFCRSKLLKKCKVSDLLHTVLTQ